MPCLPILNHSGKRRVGFLCVGNEPVEVEHNGRTYRFEWTAACGWLAVNKDRSERLMVVPHAVWDMVGKLPLSSE